MKIALYIEDGYEQIVLTPETETEKAIVGKLLDATRELTVRRGAFYHCQGGWLRQREPYGAFHQYGKQPDDESLMLCLRPVTTPADTPATDR
jgi:hypothetical protein